MRPIIPGGIWEHVDGKCLLLEVTSRGVKVRVYIEPDDLDQYVEIYLTLEEFTTPEFKLVREWGDYRKDSRILEAAVIYKECMVAYGEGLYGNMSGSMHDINIWKNFDTFSEKYHHEKSIDMNVDVNLTLAYFCPDKLEGRTLFLPMEFSSTINMAYAMCQEAYEVDGVGHTKFNKSLLTEHPDIINMLSEFLMSRNPRISQYRDCIADIVNTTR